ncbi:putative quinol monooxygenase [Erythrobacter sp. CCH5-A1]|jgi:quinol monooxygenase YgiN|uniref:putative quinol monooxygenase n=1 Tax=Erythrobacter sp. CCH5-A1 TaxID=1768792 RepID=UPI0008295031|nr:antibiotic biosynthesis monooxygenase [Erythrobacter sp. CCH5-A1]
MIERREFIGTAALALLAGAAPGLAAGVDMEEIYGLIGQMKAVPGKRAELAAILREGTGAMPGNLLYLIAEDLADPDAIWITEVWATRTDHANSLKLEAVQAAIARGRPLIAGFGVRAETRPVGYAG